MDKNKKNISKVFNVTVLVHIIHNHWKLCSHEDLPVGIVQRIIFIYLEAETLAERNTLSLKYSNDVVEYMRNNHMLTTEFKPGYISIPRNQFDSMPDTRNLSIFIETMDIFIDSVDVEKSFQEQQMSDLAGHLKALIKVSEKYRKSLGFAVAMRVFRMKELCGISLAHLENGKHWPEALTLLANTVQAIWEDVCLSNNQKGESCSWLPACIEFERNYPNPEELEYNQDVDFSKKATDIVKFCKAAGKMLPDNEVSLLKQNHVSYHLESLGRTAREKKLRKIKNSIKNEISVGQREVFKAKKELSLKDMKKVIYASRIASIFHTYGQVANLSDKVDPIDRKRCKFYACLSDQIILEVKAQTGILINFN